MLKSVESIYSYDIDLDLFERDQSCTFCSQFKHKDELSIVQMVFGHDFNRILFEDDDYVIVPALGQIVEGYLLIISKNHFNSVADFSPSMHKKFESLKNKTYEILSQNYSKPTFFEHGSSSLLELGGGCINHAHLHAVPIDLSLNYTGLTDLNPISINGISDLWNIKKENPYIYFETIGGKSYLIDIVSKLPCQYLRRVIAMKIGKPFIWNWKEYLGTNELKNTFLKLKDKF